jgi:hypothetical protein
MNSRFYYFALLRSTYEQEYINCKIVLSDNGMYQRALECFLSYHDIPICIGIR